MPKVSDRVACVLTLAPFRPRLTGGADYEELMVEALEPNLASTIRSSYSPFASYMKVHLAPPTAVSSPEVARMALNLILLSALVVAKILLQVEL
jgi:hypothetical protein